MGKFFQQAVVAHEEARARREAKKAAEEATLLLLDKIYNDQRGAFGEASRLLEGVVDELKKGNLVLTQPTKHEASKARMPSIGKAILFDPTTTNPVVEMVAAWYRADAAADSLGRYKLSAYGWVELATACVTDDGMTPDDQVWSGQFRHVVMVRVHLYLFQKKVERGYNLSLVADIDPMTVDLGELMEAVAAGAAITKAFVDAMVAQVGEGGDPQGDPHKVFDSIINEVIKPIYTEFVSQTFATISPPAEMPGPTNHPEEGAP